MNYLTEYGIGPEDLQALADFKSRFGFYKLEQDDFESMADFLRQHESTSEMIPILSDHNSNFWCVYTTGILQGTVCYFDHEEYSLEPHFKNIRNLITAIDRSPEVGDYFDFQIESFDFPKKDGIPDLDRRLEIIDALQAKLQRAPIDEELTRQTAAFSIMGFAGPDEVETLIVPFLDDEDMYVQERAVRMIDFHDYVPARERLRELRLTGMPNGKLAAERVLEKWRGR